MVMRRFCDCCNDELVNENSRFNLNQSHSITNHQNKSEGPVSVSITVDAKTYGNVPADLCMNCVLDRLLSLDKRPKPASAG